MDRNDLTVEEELVMAVSQLSATVKSLDQLLRDEYPRRQEIERRFLSKQESTRRIKLVLISSLIPIFASIFIAFFITISTVSSCFLDASPAGACEVIPGYHEAQERNDKLIAEFVRLQEVTKSNEQRISELEAKQAGQ